MVLISTFERSAGCGGDAAGCCANTGPHKAITVAAMAILPLSISTPPAAIFQMSYHTIALLPTRDRKAPPMDGGAGAPYAVLNQRADAASKRKQDHDVTDGGRRGLRSASCRSSPDQPVALSQRLLARSGNDARNDRSGVAILSNEFADLIAAGLAAGAGQTGSKSRRHAGTGARPVWRRLRHLQSALRRADGIFGGYGGRVLPGAERLAGQGMARQGYAAARLDRDPGAEHRQIRRRDRALRQGQAFRSGPDAGDGRHAAGKTRLLADLRRRRAAGLADRHPCRQQLS